MRILLLYTILVVQSQQINVLGSSQNPLCSDNRGIAISGTTIVVETAIPDPVCIRCGYLDGIQIQLLTSIDDVTYDTGGNIIVNTSDISVTNDGLILDDPGNTFSDGTGIVCTFNRPGIGQVRHTIIIQHLINNVPTLSPDGGDNQILDVIDGSNITLTCTRNSSNTVGDLYQWIHPDGQVTPGSATNSPVQVTLNSISRVESGVYVCKGTRAVFPDDPVWSNVTLNVQYSARVLSFTPGNSTVTVNTTLTLNCTYQGNPAPNTVSWSHNGTELFPDTDPNLSQTDTDMYSLLQVDFVNINIGGQYTCGVNNSIGIDQTEFTFITVQVPPGVLVAVQNDSVTTTSVTLSWSFGFNGNNAITGVDISYTVTDNCSPPHGGFASTSPNGQQTSITITELQPLTTYEFSVTVRNTVSDKVGVSSPVTITVKTLPLVLTIEVISPPNGTVTEGQSVTLECTTTTGGEPHDVSWRRELCYLPHDIVIDGSHLIILNTTVADSGEYSCYSCVGTPQEASYAFNLMVLPLFPLSSPASTTEPGKKTKGIPIYGQALILVVLLCISILSLIVNIIQSLWIRRLQNESSLKPCFQLCGHWGNKEDLTVIPKGSQSQSEPHIQDNCAYGTVREKTDKSETENKQEDFELYEHLK